MVNCRDLGRRTFTAILEAEDSVGVLHGVPVDGTAGSTRSETLDVSSTLRGDVLRVRKWGEGVGGL